MPRCCVIGFSGGGRSPTIYYIYSGHMLPVCTYVAICCLYVHMLHSGGRSPTIYYMSAHMLPVCACYYICWWRQVAYYILYICTYVACMCLLLYLRIFCLYMRRSFLLILPLEAHVCCKAIKALLRLY
jgi:hypothetical protein